MANTNVSDAYYDEALNLIEAKAGYSTDQANLLISSIQNWYANFSSTAPLTDTQTNQENDLIDRINLLTDNNPDNDNQDISYVPSPSYGDLIPSTPSWVTNLSNTITNPGGAIAELIQNNFGTVLIGSAVLVGGLSLYVYLKLRKK